MIRVVPMEVSMEWLLFVLTAIIYVTTFLVLQMIADRFRDYILHQDTLIVPGSNADTRNDTTKNVIGGNKIEPTKMGAVNFRFDSQVRGVYRELHDTLDVSVFK